MSDNYPHARVMIDFLNERLDDEEQTARAAIQPEKPGHTWHWVTRKGDLPATTSDDDPTYLWDVSLRTVEQFPTSVGDLPGFLIEHADEVIATAAVHIAHHDPAHVLADIAWKRELLALADEAIRVKSHVAATFLYHIVTRMVRVYQCHPDYLADWDRLYGTADKDT